MKSPLFRPLARTLRSKPGFRPFLLFLALTVAFGTTGCDQAEHSPPTPADPVGTWYPLTIGTTELQIQLVLNREEQRRGLMHRETLGADEGMVFLFPRPGPRSFWMKNTRIPLDIGYFGPEGKLVEIHPLYPFDETRVPSSSDRIQIAIETNQGWFRLNGIKPGAKIDLKQLEMAVHSRGGDFPRYQLGERQP